MISNYPGGLKLKGLNIGLNLPLIYIPRAWYIVSDGENEQELAE